MDPKNNNAPRDAWKAAAIGLVLLVLSSFLSQTIQAYSGIREDLTVGALFALFALVHELRVDVDGGQRAVLHEVKQLLTSFKDKQDRDFLDEVHSSLRPIQEILKTYPQSRRSTTRSLLKAIREVQRTMIIRRFGENGEEERRQIVHDAVREAKRCILAVTYDAHEYLETFWKLDFGSEYVATNKEVTRRGVVIRRLFVIEDAVLDPNTQNTRAAGKREALKQILDRFGGAQGISNDIVLKSEAERHVPDWDRSFLLCDDNVVTASRSGSDPGYVYFDGHDHERLEIVFNTLEKLKRSPKEYGLG